MRLLVPRLFEEAEGLGVLLVRRQRHKRRAGCLVRARRLVRRDGAEGAGLGGGIVAFSLLRGAAGLVRRRNRGLPAGRHDGRAARCLPLLEGGEPEVHVGDQPLDPVLEPAERVVELLEVAGDAPPPLPGFVDVGLELGEAPAISFRRAALRA